MILGIQLQMPWNHLHFIKCHKKRKPKKYTHVVLYKSWDISKINIGVQIKTRFAYCLKYVLGLPHWNEKREICLNATRKCYSLITWKWDIWLLSDWIISYDFCDWRKLWNEKKIFATGNAYRYDKEKDNSVVTSDLNVFSFRVQVWRAIMLHLLKLFNCFQHTFMNISIKEKVWSLCDMQCTL